MKMPWTLAVFQLWLCVLTSGAAYSQSRSLQDFGVQLRSRSKVKVYLAKQVISLDPATPSGEAIGVIGDRILAVGSLDKIKDLAGDAPLEVDRTLADQVIVPGFIAQHDHPLLTSLTMKSAIIAIEDWVLPSGTVPAAKNREEYVERLREAESQLKDPEALLLTWGFHHYFHGKLTRSNLDQISRQRPILVWHRSCHEFILNTAAIERFEITEEYLSKQTPSAQQQSNLDEGHFWEQGLFGVLPQLAPAIATPERLTAGLKFTVDYLHANGITLGCEPGGLLSKELQDAQNAILSDPSVPFRFYFIPDGKSLIALNPDNVIGETEKVMGWGKGKTAMVPRQIKLFADGAIYSQLMQLKDGYTDGHEGEWMMDLNVFAKAFKEYWDAGYQIHVHVNGDAGLEMVLNNLESNMQRRPRDDHRTTIVHFAVSTKDQVDRIKRLGALVSANPYYPIALADQYGKSGLGPERADPMTRLGDVERAGVSFSLHSDMPMAPAQPLYLMHCAVNRMTNSGRVAAPEQRISRIAALKAVTLDAAYSLQMENEVGSLAPGKLANFTVLSENPVTCDPLKIKDVRIWGTMHEGRLLPCTAAKAPVAQSPVDTQAQELAHIRRLNDRYWRSQLIDSSDRSMTPFPQPAARVSFETSPKLASGPRSCSCGSPLIHALMAGLTAHESDR